MSENNEYTEAAAALIRMYAETQRGVGDTYSTLGEVKAADRAMGIAERMERAAELLRKEADPPYDAKAAAASHLAGEVWRYLDSITKTGRAYSSGLAQALEVYDAIDAEEV